MEKGKFIVIEGVDGSGKSSTIRKAAPMLDQTNIQFTKGFSHESTVERFIDAHPQSIAYYLLLLHKNDRQVIPTLDSGKHVIQDRYKQTVDTFEPDASYLINRLFITLANPWFIQPNIYVQFLANVETIVERLVKKNEQSFSQYHQSLIDKPILIEQRQERYQKIFERMNEPKYVIDTTRTTVSEAAEQLMTIFERNNLC